MNFVNHIHPENEEIISEISDLIKTNNCECFSINIKYFNNWRSVCIALNKSKHFKKIKHLILANMNLNITKINLLALYLKNNNHLESLNFRNNYLNSKCLELIIDNILIDNKVLKSIDISKNKLDDKEIFALLSKYFNLESNYLKELNISYNNVGAEHIRILLSNTKIYKNKPNLESINQHTSLKDVGDYIDNSYDSSIDTFDYLDYHSKCNLERLNISGNLLKNEGLSVLVDYIKLLRYLSYLNISNNNINNIKNLTKIISLNKDTLKHIDFSLNSINSNISDNSHYNFLTSIINNNYVLCLNLDSCNLINIPEQILMYYNKNANSLDSKSNIKELKISDVNINNFDSNKIDILFKIFPKLESLYIGYSINLKSENNSLFYLLFKYKNEIKELYINSFFDDNIQIEYLTSFISSIDNIYKLNNNYNLKNFNFSNLKSIDLSFLKLNDKTLKILSKYFVYYCKFIENINLNNNNFTSTKYINFIIKYCNNIKCLYLVNCFKNFKGNFSLISKSFQKRRIIYYLNKIIYIDLALLPKEYITKNLIKEIYYNNKINSKSNCIMYDNLIIDRNLKNIYNNCKTNYKNVHNFNRYN